MASKASDQFVSDGKSNGRLPSGWKMLRFDQFAMNIAERVDPAETDATIYVGLEHLDAETLQIHRWGEPDDVIGQKLVFSKGDVVFGRRRAYQRKLAVAEFDGICSAHAMVVRAIPDEIEPEFLPFFMYSDAFMERAEAISVGSLSPTINWKTLRIQEFALPPIDEQRRIVAILSAANAAAEHFSRALQELRLVHSKSVLELTQRASGATEGKLEQFTQFITDGDHNPPKRIDSGIPHVVVKHIVDGRIALDDVTYISGDDFEKVRKRYDPAPEDLILTCVGSVGRMAIVPSDFIFSADRSLALIRFNTSKVIPRFGMALLSTTPMQRQIERRSIGTAQLHLYLRDIRSLRVTIPPIAEQERILAVVENFDRTEKALQEHVSTMLHMRRTLVEHLIGVVNGARKR